MKKIVLIIMMAMLLCSCSGRTFSVSGEQINVMKYDTRPFLEELHSAEYLVVDISDCQFLFAKDSDVKMYPASLTKLVTLDAVLNLSNDLSETSHVTENQFKELIDEDASMAFIQRDYEYTLEDLLYALILPSGADGALALQNYYENRGVDLVAEMNRLVKELGGTSTHFVNTTGLHDDDHYTSLEDLYLVVMDILNYEKGREILNSLVHTLADGTVVHTTVGVAYRDAGFTVIGGKTGYTPEAGQNIIALCREKGKSYLVMMGNAYGQYSLNQYWHYDDVVKVFEYLRSE